MKDNENIFKIIGETFDKLTKELCIILEVSYPNKETADKHKQWKIKMNKAIVHLKLISMKDRVLLKEISDKLYALYELESFLDRE